MATKLRRDCNIAIKYNQLSDDWTLEITRKVPLHLNGKLSYEYRKIYKSVKYVSEVHQFIESYMKKLHEEDAATPLVSEDEEIVTKPRHLKAVAWKGLKKVLPKYEGCSDEEYVPEDV